MLEKIIRLFAPFSCLMCDTEADSLLCFDCVTVVPRVPPRCYRCKAVSGYYEICRYCRRQTPLQIVVPFTFHRDAAKELIHSFKYERARSALDILIKAIWPDDVFPVDAVLVPVPTATRRVRSRGYDQAVVLAQLLSCQSGLRVVRTLNRLGQAHQVGANRNQRLRQLQSSFYVTRRHLIRDRNMILVDDVLTTGATLETAARLLRRAGAKSVSAIVIAQA